ncbi:MAG: hypothetical protein QJR03_06615 [Sphaerobacter sp.]|nr:hypothetical protein [Sphaerobacter sp.]
MRERPARLTRADRPPVDQRNIWANALLAAGGRMGIAAVLVVGRVLPLPTPALTILIALVPLVLLCGIVQAGRVGWPRWGAVWLMDFATLSFLTPVLLWNGFAAAGPPRLLPAERSVYLETVIVAFMLLALLGGLAGWLAGRQLGVAAILLLPAVLEVPALVPALTDYRDATAFEALVSAYAVASVVTLIAWLGPAAWRLWLGPLATVAYLAFLMLVPGLGMLARRPAPVSAFHPLLIAFGLFLVVAAPLFGVRLRLGPRRGSRRRSRRRTRVGTDAVDVVAAAHESERPE